MWFWEDFCLQPKIPLALPLFLSIRGTIRSVVVVHILLARHKVIIDTTFCSAAQSPAARAPADR